MVTISTRRAALRVMLAGALLLALWGRVAAQAPTPPGPTAMPPPLPDASLHDPFKPPPAPRLPHELRRDTWPQPDYFQEALQLTRRKPQERAASLRLRLPADRPVPAYIVLPVQTQAFGFAAAFRALLGAELDAQLEQLGIPATSQIDIVDAHGPFVRRLGDAATSELQRQFPASKAIVLHVGHDGADTLFVTLVVRDAKGQAVAHRGVPLVDDPAQAVQAAAALLPDLFRTAGLPSQPRAPHAGAAPGCDVSAWNLANPAAQATPMQKACLALAVGSLLPDFDDSGMPAATQATEAKLAWLARAHAQAALQQPQSPESRAVRQLAWAQLGLAPAKAPGVAGLIGAKDAVVSRVARLMLLSQVHKSPVKSERDGIRRQVQTIVNGLPALPAAAVEALAAFADPFGEVDQCSFERNYPGAMLSPSCRQLLAPGGTSPARPASRAEFMLFQEWRIAAWYADLRRTARTLGQPERARAIAAGMPADVAAHPFVQRLAVAAGVHDVAGGSFDDLLESVRSESGAIVGTMVDLQRNDSWVDRYSLSEHLVSANTHVSNDAQVRENSDDDARLLGVLKFDRFVGGLNPPFRRQAGDTAFFLRPERGQMQFGLMQARFAGLAAATAPAARAAASAPAVAWKRPPLFGTGKPWRPVPSPEQLAEQLAQRPTDMSLRVELALARLRRGGSMADAVALIAAQPANQRSDERIAESHTWALPAHAFFFAAEPEAAQRFYETVARIGTGSQSDLHARGRILLLAGRFGDALEANQRRMQRYDSDFARRDVAGMLFMKRQNDAAWQLLRPRAALGGSIQLWDGMMVGHRMAGWSPAQAGEWIRANGLDKVQVRFKDLHSLYPHLLAVVDRVPDDADIAMLGRPAGTQTYVAPRWGSSALLVRAAMTGEGEEAARQQVLGALKDSDPEQVRFMLPTYAWVAWKATQGQDELLEAIRGADVDADFDGLLAKSMVMALEGKIDESLRFFSAARYTLADLGLGGAMLDRAIPAPYQFALAGQLMHRQTGNEAFRRDTLRFVRVYQRVQPFLGWTYSLEALLEAEPKARLTAACRAQFLDPKSYFLKRAAVPGLSATACKAALW